MKKYLLRYFILWLPAVLVATFYNNASPPSQILQWSLVFLFVFGWSVNTGMSAYNYPRSTLSLLLCYTGFNILAIVFMYMTNYDTGLHILMKNIGGLMSFRPLDILVYSLSLLGGQPWELFALAFLFACCMLGYLFGLVQRRVRPNPYRPRIRRS